MLLECNKDVILAIPVLRWCFWCARFREIMLDAPWSSFDLSMSVILILRGLYLIAGFSLLETTYSIYKPLAGFIGLWQYGWVCLIAGCVQFLMTLWPVRPPFEIRLLARMGVCFCFIAFSLNQISNIPPPVGFITHFILSLLSIWTVLRTSRKGG